MTMIGVVAVIRVKEGREAEFEAGFRELTAQVKANEPGARMYQLTRSRAEPRTYKVLEVYEDDAALEAHRTSEHYKVGGRKLREVAEAPPEVEVLDAVL
jgi:quinol monooxygenase YgiN